MVFMVAVVLTSGCTSVDGVLDMINSKIGNQQLTNDTSYVNISASTPTKTYSAYGVSFKYPSSWSAESENESGSNMIFAFKEISFNNVQFQIQILPNNGMSEEEAIRQIQDGNLVHSTISPSWEKKSSHTMTIDNKTAYEDIFLVNDSHFSKLMRIAQITLVKNDKTYLILLQAPDEEFDKEKPYFALILNSLKFH